MVNNPDIRILHRDTEVDVDTWLKTVLVLNTSLIPKNIQCEDKILAELFTNQIEAKLAKNWCRKRYCIF
jgi:two-component system osmolarity sensor histidine kinase EnvZ